MSKNNNLHAAKTAKNDEFYTKFEDINSELNRLENGYRPLFEGKVIYCNCDDPEESNFWKFFYNRFKAFKLKLLISTHYNMDGSSSYMLTYDGNETVGKDLKGNGDFSSKECVDILDKYKGEIIVVTNPPFSLFRDFIHILVKHEAKFAVIGNMNAITYKEIFPLIKEDKLWLGYNYVKSFTQPNGTIKKFGNILWFTNLDIPKRHRPIPLGWRYYLEDNVGKYPKYDNYDAINVDKVNEIPCDYDGVMGVPITFLTQYCPEQFEIVSFRKGEDGKDLVFTREREREFNLTFVSLYNVDSRDDKKRRRENQWQDYLRSNNDKKKVNEPIDYFYPISTNLKNGMINDYTINGKKGYCRMLIRRKGKRMREVNN